MFSRDILEVGLHIKNSYARALGWVGIPVGVGDLMFNTVHGGAIAKINAAAVAGGADADVADALRRRLEAAHALDARVREENARLAKSRKYVTHEVNETRKTAAAQTRMESQS